MLSKATRWDSPKTQSSSECSMSERSVGVVKDYPLSSMMVVFGVGMGIGVLLSQAVCVPLMHAMQPEPTFSEKLGHRIYEAVASTIPESLMRRMSA